MQEVITKTIVILVALAAIVWFYNRLNRKKGPGCPGGCDCDCSPEEKKKCCPPEEKEE